VGVRISFDGEQKFEQFLREKENRLYAILAEAMIVIMHEAEWEAKAISLSRFDTGAMFDAISSKVEFAARKIVGEAGFIDGAADYYIYQTVTGFRHWLSGEFIDPTHALRTASEKAYHETQAAIAKAIASA
jgi:hypothetical protein